MMALALALNDLGFGFGFGFEGVGFGFGLGFDICGFGFENFKALQLRPELSSCSNKSVHVKFCKKTTEMVT